MKLMDAAAVISRMPCQKERRKRNDTASIATKIIGTNDSFHIILAIATI